MTDAVSSAAAGARDSRLAAIAPAALAFAAAVVIRLFSHLNNDVSWLLILGEKMAAGARPYVDFLEVNPPASILLYYPTVLAGHALGIAPEVLVNILVFVAAGASLAFCASLLRTSRLVEERDLGKLGGVTGFIILILPVYVFAQREHFALMAILPMLCVYTARASGRDVRLHHALAAGIACGFTVIIKPYFALAAVLPWAYVLWQRRNAGEFRKLVFAPENLSALVLSLAYVAFVAWQFPSFLTNELPLVSAVYLPVRLSFLMFLTTPSCLFFSVGALTAATLCGHRLRELFFAIPFLAAFGFIAAAAIQGKGWPYHVYPALALILLVPANLLALDPQSRKPVVRVVLLAMMTCGSCYWFSRNAETPAVLEALQRKHLSHPKILLVWGDMNLGHPLTRALGGSWAGTACSMWVTYNASYLLSRGGLDQKTSQALKQFVAWDRKLIVRDILTNRPDVILIGNRTWHNMAMSHAELRAALDAYRPDQTVGKVEIWLRKSGG